MKRKIYNYYYKSDGETHNVFNNDIVFLEVNKEHTFFVDFDTDQNFAPDYIPVKEELKSNIKWTFLDNYTYIKVSKGEISDTSVWGKFIDGEGSTVIKAGNIGRHYLQKDKITITSTIENNNFGLGIMYRLLMFIDDPSDGVTLSFIFVNPKPLIRIAYFDEQKINYEAELGEKDGLYSYQTTIPLYIDTHAIPLYSYPKDGGRVVNELKEVVVSKVEDYNIKVELLDLLSDTTPMSDVKRDYVAGDEYKFILDEPILDGDLSDYYHDSTIGDRVNVEYIVPITIDIAWREKLKLTKEKNPTKKYYVLVVITHKTTGARYLYTSTKRRWLTNETGYWVDIPISHYFEVKHQQGSEIFKALEEAKNNMIHYVGDIEYRVKEFDPCGYSKIMIEDTQDKDREKEIVFDEDRLVSKGDQTDTFFFDIIRGETPSKVLISLDNLKVNNVECKGVLLEKGETHAKLENVFNIESVYGAQKDENGEYKREEDKTHKRQLKRSGIKVTKENEYDTDVIRDDEKGKLVVGNLQNLVKNRDYHFASSNSLSLDLKYIYNKSYDNDVLRILGYHVDYMYSTLFEYPSLRMDTVDIAWVMRYIWWEDYYVQTYFVPVSTCRYPNQIVKIRVFPDLEWWIRVSLNSDDKVYTKQSPNHGYREFKVKDNENQVRNGKRRAEEAKNLFRRHKEGETVKEYFSSRSKILNDFTYDLEVDVGFKVGGKEYNIIPGDGFPLFKAIKFMLKAYEIFNLLTFEKETRDKESTIADNTEERIVEDVGTSVDTSALTAEEKEKEKKKKEKEARDKEKKMGKRYQERKKYGKAFRIEVSAPSLSTSVEGKFSPSEKVKTKGQIGYGLEFNFAASPLFSVSGELDLLYYAQYIGPIGKALKTMSDIVRNVDYLTLGAVRIDYYFNLGAKVDFNVSVNQLRYHSIDKFSDGKIEIEIPITLSLSAGVNTKITIKTSEAKIEAIGETSAKLTAKIVRTTENGENSWVGSVNFDGLDAKVHVNMSVKDKPDNEDTEDKPEDKPTIINILAPDKEPWTIKLV